MVVDIHVHTRHHPGPNRPGTDQTYATPEQLIEMYDEVGIDRAVILPGTNPECSHHIQSVQDVLEICERWPRFIPFCNIHPLQIRNSPEADLGHLMEWFKGAGCKGIGEVTANMAFDDPHVLNLFRHAQEFELPITFHVATQVGGTYGLVDDLNLPRFSAAVEKFPDLVFFCHSQAFWSEISGDVTEETRGGYPKGPVTEGGKAVELIMNNPNVYGDLSAGSGFNAVSRDPEFGYWFLSECQDKLLFGTDVCAPKNRDNVLVNLKRFLDQAAFEGNISREAYDKITSGNAVRLLGL
ncbi:MAG: amidohydrolase family protein [candidate division WS1 bacterium]|jgi:predicted TIM-barrel fold metal-dependent hydrolase|nr:amidohydrolase family protein [candidate division WS1 bacterium]